MKRLLLAATTIAGLAASLPAAAQFQKPEDAIKYRQGAFNVMAATSAASAPWPTAARPSTPRPPPTTWRSSTSCPSCR
jgi:hypothetical protein